HFKIINDRCGHRAGDALLSDVARLLSQHVRKTDVLARLGGDEFALVLPNCTLDCAQQRAQQICDDIRQLRFMWNDRRYSITFSVGVASFGGDALASFSEG